MIPAWCIVTYISMCCCEFYKPYFQIMPLNTQTLNLMYSGNVQTRRGRPPDSSLSNNIKTPQRRCVVIDQSGFYFNQIMLPLYYPYNADMSIYGSLPSRDPIQLVVCKWCGRTVKDTAMLRHQGTIYITLPHFLITSFII